MKLVIRERESVALQRYLRAHRELVSCALIRVEVVRAARPHGRSAVTRARSLIGRIDQIALDEQLLDAAGLLAGGRLRSLDAIHLAAARSLGADLEAVVTYDGSMSAAGQTLGLPIHAPA